MGRAVREVLESAPHLLVQHPDRAVEIALGVQRLRPHDVEFAAPLTARFVTSFAQLAQQRLPAQGSMPTRAQTREALVSYIALLDLDATTDSARQLGSCIARGATLLDTSTIAAALAKVGGQDAEVALAFQRRLADEAVLNTLSAMDLHAVAAGIARAAKILPQASAAVVNVVDARLDELPAPGLCDTLRAVIELQARSPEQKETVCALLRRAWHHLAPACRRSLASGSSNEELAQMLPAISRLAAALQLTTTGRGVADGFVAEVLRPIAPALLALVRDEPETLELVGPLLHKVGGDAWAGFLQQVAIEGLPRFPAGCDSTERIICILEAVADTAAADAAEGGVAMPPSFKPFFDFALEELMGRLASFKASHLHQTARLFGRVHLERPDHLAVAATAIARTELERKMPSFTVADLALHLSGFAALYIRIASDCRAAAASRNAAAAYNEALEAIAAVFKEHGAGCEAALRSTKELTRDLHEDPCASGEDAICLALSAFAQVICRVPAATAPLARQQIMVQGSRVVEAAGALWARTGVDLSPPQAHIFITVFRALFVGQDAVPPTPEAIGMLRRLITRVAAAPAADRESRLCLAMLGELLRDRSCPEELRGLLANGLPSRGTQADISMGGSVAGAYDKGVGASADRLRRHMQDAASAPVQPELNAAAGRSARPADGSTGLGERAGGLFRRIFGF